MKRGLTMIELLAALSLMTVVMVAAASWLQVMSKASVAAAEPARWEAAAQAVLSLVHDDLVVGDFGVGAPRARVGVENGVLQIQTRATGAGDVVGPVVHRYLFDPSSRELGLKEQTRQRRQDERRLIHGLAAWEVELDKEKRVLSIVMRSTHGATVTRSYRLP